MSREEKITYIITAIQDDANLIKLMRLVVTNNITNSTPDSMPDEKLAAFVAYLQQGN